MTCVQEYIGDILPPIRTTVPSFREHSECLNLPTETNLNKDFSSEERNLNCESQNTNKCNESFDNLEEKPLDCEISNMRKERVTINKRVNNIKFFHIIVSTVI
jgi:hypothetical protein